MQTLSPHLVNQVLERLGLSGKPALNPSGLETVYSAWCKAVPFDNVRKLIHLKSGSNAPLPGDDPADFFSHWLTHGTGGTCWAGNGALCTLLTTLGFHADRGIATMLVTPDPSMPPNHGTVTVDFDGHRYLVDASILHQRPIALDEDIKQNIPNAELRKRNGQWFVWWLPGIMDGLECRIDSLIATAAEFVHHHQNTKEWSPFNYQLNARIVKDDGVLAISKGEVIQISNSGSVRRLELTEVQLRQILIEEFHVSESLVSQLPHDQRTPPPPAVHVQHSPLAVNVH